MSETNFSKLSFFFILAFTSSYKTI